MKENRSKKQVLIVWLLTLSLLVMVAETYAADTLADDYLHASNSALYDREGNQVRFTGIAWFGFETPNQVYHGLWSANMEDILDTIADHGFNLLRIPLSVQLVNQWRNGNGAQPGSVNYFANPDLEGMSSLEILDASIAYCKQIGLKVMLDMHRVVNTQMLNGWYTDGYPPGDFEADWQWLAQRYVGDDTVIAMDLFNEPHGTPGDSKMIKWDDSTDQNNWKHEAEQTANLILDINPNLLIVVEGVEATPKAGYTYAETNSANYDFNWWGGNLRRVQTHPINLGSRQSQLVYSPHEYGPSVYVQPWFYPGFTKESLTADSWQPNWLYIATQNIAPVLIGEWGGRMDGGDNQKWMGFLAETIVQHGLNHTFWCVNPNSGDTGGILLDDWQSVDAAKYDLIEPTLWKDANGKFIGLDHQANLGSNGTHIGAATNPGNGDDGDTVPVTGMSVAPTHLVLEGPTMDLLTATVTPENATDQTVTWSSSDTHIARVSDSGLVSAVSNGTVTITATTGNGSFSATCTVTVTGIDNDTPTPCDSPSSAHLPFTIDGEGKFCRLTSGDITFINSWNTERIEINGENFTNTWSNQLPNRINGNYYIYYVGKYPWSHLEVNGSGNAAESGDGNFPETCSGQCNAATPVNPDIRDDGGIGNITMYSTSASNGGACIYGATDVMYYGAINVNMLPGDGRGQWQGGKICGQCAEVTALTSQGAKSVVVRIMDKCPDDSCGIDLGGAAASRIMLDGSGRYEGEWKFVSCDGHPEVFDGEPTLDVLAGSNAWWSRVHVRNSPAATDYIEWQDTDGSAYGTLPFANDPENSFEVPTFEVLQSGMSSVLITIHYVDGTKASVTLTPDQLANGSTSYPIDNSKI